MRVLRVHWVYPRAFIVLASIMIRVIRGSLIRRLCLIDLAEGRCVQWRRNPLTCKLAYDGGDGLCNRYSRLVPMLSWAWTKIRIWWKLALIWTGWWVNIVDLHTFFNDWVKLGICMGFRSIDVKCKSRYVCQSERIVKGSQYACIYVHSCVEIKFT